MRFQSGGHHETIAGPLTSERARAAAPRGEGRAERGGGRDGGRTPAESWRRIPEMRKRVSNPFHLTRAEVWALTRPSAIHWRIWSALTGPYSDWLAPIFYT